MRHRRALVISLVAVALGACATQPRLEPPIVALERVEIDWQGSGPRFAVTLALINPNDREIAAQAVDAQLRLEDAVVGNARLAAPLRLPPNGRSTASLVALVDPTAMMTAVFGFIARGGDKGASPKVRYGVSGTVTLDNGAIIPFSRSGEFALSNR